VSLRKHCIHLVIYPARCHNEMSNQWFTIIHLFIQSDSLSKTMPARTSLRNIILYINTRTKLPIYTVLHEEHNQYSNIMRQLPHTQLSSVNALQLYPDNSLASNRACSNGCARTSRPAKYRLSSALHALSTSEGWWNSTNILTSISASSASLCFSW
jgi:hypothetical protein